MNEKKSINILIVSRANLPDIVFNEVKCEKVYAPDAGSAIKLIGAQSPEIIIIDISDCAENTERLLSAAVKSEAAGIIAIAGQDDADKLREKYHGIHIAARPFSDNCITETVRIIAVTYMRLKRYEKQVHSLQEEVEEIKKINHAKWVLIRALGLTEQEAHRMIEKQAMNMRMSKREISEHIIKTYQN